MYANHLFLTGEERSPTGQKLVSLQVPPVCDCDWMVVVSEGQNEHPSPVISSSFFLFSWEFVSLRVCGALLSVCLACLSLTCLSVSGE